jgi:hypothetical protein
MENNAIIIIVTLAINILITIKFPIKYKVLVFFTGFFWLFAFLLIIFNYSENNKLIAIYSTMTGTLIYYVRYKLIGNKRD